MPEEAHTVGTDSLQMTSAMGIALNGWYGRYCDYQACRVFWLGEIGMVWSLDE